MSFVRGVLLSLDSAVRRPLLNQIVRLHGWRASGASVLAIFMNGFASSEGSIDGDHRDSIYELVVGIVASHVPAGCLRGKLHDEKSVLNEDANC